MYYLALSESGESWETPEILCFHSKYSRDEWVAADESLWNVSCAPIPARIARAYIERALRRAYNAGVRFGITLDEIPDTPIEDLILAYKQTDAWQYDHEGVIV